MSEERTCPSGHKLPVEQFKAYVDLTIKDIDEEIKLDCPGGKRGHTFSLRKAIVSGMFNIEEAAKIRLGAQKAKHDAFKVA
jgi:hypothetical protein